MELLTAKDQKDECDVVRDRRIKMVRVLEEKNILEKDMGIICNQERWWKGSHGEMIITVKVANDQAE